MNLNNISPYKKKIQFSHSFNQIHRLLKKHSIQTICHSGRCPNRTECFAKKKLTFLILGNICTRNCSFCNVKKGIPINSKMDDANQIIAIIKKLNLQYIVITSVTRDDLKDGGAKTYVRIVNLIKSEFPEIKIEILIPDFKGEALLLNLISQAKVDIIGHNIETVQSLYPFIRPQGDYTMSLQILKDLKQGNKKRMIKSGFMVGLGETGEEIKEVLNHLHQHQVDIITIGQYFQPSLHNTKVIKFYSDKEFKDIEKYAKETGFQYVSVGRFVRSSYYAEEIFKQEFNR